MTIEQREWLGEVVSYNAADVMPVNWGIHNGAPTIVTQTETVTGDPYAAQRSPGFAATYPKSASMRTVQLLNELKLGMAQKFRLTSPR